jgi:hypothetical protein
MVRGFQARNFMRDQMQVGDAVFFYHSSCPEPGIAGLAEVAKLAYPDETQFDRASKYYEPKATRDKPYWYNVDVKFKKKTRLVSLAELRTHPQLQTCVFCSGGIGYRLHRWIPQSGSSSPRSYWARSAYRTCFAYARASLWMLCEAQARLGIFTTSDLQRPAVLLAQNTLDSEDGCNTKVANLDRSQGSIGDVVAQSWHWLNMVLGQVN